MSEKIQVVIDPDLADLIPGFLANRANDVESIKGLLAKEDFAAIRIIGHSMKGAGGGYGFDPITDIGGQIEDAAMAEDATVVDRMNDQLADYLERVELVFGE